MGVWVEFFFGRLIVWLILSKFIFSGTIEDSVIDDTRDFVSHFA